MHFLCFKVEIQRWKSQVPCPQEIVGIVRERCEQYGPGTKDDIPWGGSKFAGESCASRTRGLRIPGQIGGGVCFGEESLSMDGVGWLILL